MSAGPEDRFAANLRYARRHRGLSQEALAAAMAARGYRWHQATVYKVESGERRIQLGEAVAVATILAVPLEPMAGGEPPAPLLATDELHALDLAAELMRTLRRIAGDGPSRESDLGEVVAHVRAVQNTVMAQAATRAYPDRFRLLGGAS